MKQKYKIFFWNIKLKSYLIWDINTLLHTMSFSRMAHKNQYLQNLSSIELHSLKDITEKKKTYYESLLKEAIKAEEENQDDYGMLATAQAEMDYAERKILKCEKKLKVIRTFLAN